METRSDWYKRATSEVSPYKDTLSKRERKKYKLDLLMRVAARIDEFSAYCGECQAFQPEITGLTENLGNLIQIPNREERKNHLKLIGNIVKHLQKQHKLVTEGYYMGIGITIGVGIGTALAAALDSGIGTAVGIAIGIAIGNYLDRKAKREGKVI